MLQDADVNGSKVCQKKSVMLNVFPSLSLILESATNSFVFDVTTTAYKTMDLKADPLVSAPIKPDTPVKKEDINLLLGIGATYLSAATSAIALAALTLY